MVVAKKKKLPRGRPKGANTGDIPASCPPALAEFIRWIGSKHQAKKALRIGDTVMNDVVHGHKPMPPAWAGTMSNHRAAVSASAQIQQPPALSFVPWDKTTRTVVLPASRGIKARKFKNVPAPVAELLEKCEMNMSAAGRAMGTSGGPFMMLFNGRTTFSDRWQRRVFAALHDVPSAGVASGEEPDLYTLDLAVVLVPAKNYDRVNDVADLLDGRAVFRLNTSTGWLVLYRMKAEDARKFKRIAARDCTKIVCP